MTSRRFRIVVGMLVGLGMAASACSDPAQSADAPPGADGATTDGATVDTATGADAAADAVPADCPAGELCVRVRKVVPSATIPDGRLIVVFYQLLDNLESLPPLHVGLDLPFDGASTRVDVGLDLVVLPAMIDDYRVCPRTCLDLSNPACDCQAGQARAALAFVFAMQDLDGSGGIDPAELVEENLYGVGYFQLGASDADYPIPNILDGLFTEGILDGLVPYRIVDDPSSGLDVLGLPPPGTVFELDVCVPGDVSCDQVRFPNLT